MSALTAAGTEPVPYLPGELQLADAPVPLNPGAPRTTLHVVNTGDRPIQVGSHFHFAEANPSLAFDRDRAWGLRLDIPAGTAVRFEPGLARDVVLIPVGGRRVIPGLRGLAVARGAAGGELDA